jgi:hypothetical protein
MEYVRTESVAEKTGYVQRKDSSNHHQPKTDTNFGGQNGAIHG